MKTQKLDKWSGELNNGYRVTITLKMVTIRKESEYVVSVRYTFKSGNGSRISIQRITDVSAFESLSRAKQEFRFERWNCQQQEYMPIAN